MTWRGAWSRYNPVAAQTCGEGIYPRWGAQRRPRNIFRRGPSDPKHGAASQPNGDKSPRHKSISLRACRLLQGERQQRVNRLPLRQALLELHRIVNQHILPGERLGGDQPRQPEPHTRHAQQGRP